MTSAEGLRLKFNERFGLKTRGKPYYLYFLDNALDNTHVFCRILILSVQIAVNSKTM